jgi:hypothetical protein
VRRRTAAAIAGAVAAVGVAAGLVTQLSGGPTARAFAAPLTRIAPPATPTPTPEPTHIVPPVPHDLVAPAPPTSFELVGAGFDVKARVCGMANVRPLDPPGDQYHTVCWVREGFGVAPGSSAAGTTYVLGHSWAEAPLVLNPLSIPATAGADLNHPVTVTGVPTYPTAAVNGYRLVLATPNGTLTYVVTDAYLVSKEQAANVQPLMNERDPNRVVLITCAVRKSGANLTDLDYNVIVDARLYSSTKA